MTTRKHEFDDEMRSLEGTEPVEGRKDWKDWGERCYRRGVHQALAMLDAYLHQPENLEVDPARALDIASSTARTIRYHREKHEWLMDEVL